MQDINLIPQELQKAKARASRVKSIFVVSLAILGVSLVASIGLFAYKYSLQLYGKQVEVKISDQEKKISNLKQIAEKMLILGDKLKMVSYTLSNRPIYSNLLTQMAKVIPSGVYIVQLDTTAADKISLSGAADSYVVLADLIKNIVLGADTAESIFDYSELSSVSYKEGSNKIDFSMDIFLKKGVLQGGNIK